MSLSRRLVFLLLPPLLTALWLYLPYPPLEMALRSLAGVELTDRHGQTLYYLPGEEGSFMAKLSAAELSPAVREIFVRLEDRRFYRHRGIDLLAVARAAVENLSSRRVVSGASTISMQAARLLAPHGGGVAGKLREVLAALRLEAKLTKEEILLFYLNRLPFGYNTRGVAAAARTYFNRPLEELSRAQVLLLAVLPKSPAAFDPFNHPERLRAKALSLGSLARIPAAEIEEAVNTFERGGPFLRAPHFVFSVREELERLSSGKRWPALRGEEIARVVTTLDYGLYLSSVATLERELSRSRGAIRNAAALVIDNGSGEVLAWVGSTNFFDPEASGHIDGVRVRSPSGSTLKPFLYALALDEGYTAASLLPDLRLSFGGEESYRPENFDRRSRGLVRLRSALAGSLNVPAVYLLSQVGVEAFLKTSAALGFSLERDAKERYGLGMAIGNAPVTLLELTRAFSVFPRKGTLPALRRVVELQTVSGKRVPLPAAAPRRVFSPESAWLVWSILSDPSARVTGFGLRSRFNTSYPAMFKSGTASGYQSLWCLGAVPGFTVGVWAGNFDRRGAFGATGSSVPAAAVTAILEELGSQGAAPVAGPNERAGLQAGPGRALAGPPRGIITERICTLTGLLASPSCPSTRLEYFQAGKRPEKICPVHAGAMGLEQLALETFLDGGEAPRVLFPRHDSIFYRDLSIAEGQQGIPVWIIAPPGETLELSLNGSTRTLSYPFAVELPVRPGAYRLRVSGRSGQEELSYYVR